MIVFRRFPIKPSTFLCPRSPYLHDRKARRHLLLSSSVNRIKVGKWTGRSIATSKIDFQSRGFSPLRLVAGIYFCPATSNPAIQQNDQDKTKMGGKGEKKEEGRNGIFSKNNHCALGEKRVTLSNRERENE